MIILHALLLACSTNQIQEAKDTAHVRYSSGYDMDSFINKIADEKNLGREELILNYSNGDDFRGFVVGDLNNHPGTLIAGVVDDSSEYEYAAHCAWSYNVFYLVPEDFLNHQSADFLNSFEFGYRLEDNGTLYGYHARSSKDPVHLSWFLACSDCGNTENILTELFERFSSLQCTGIFKQISESEKAERIRVTEKFNPTRK